jgi:DhnA family fructose-bisphosphate aldolase class Ia
MIARYAMDYNKVPYLVKLNSRTNLLKVEQAEPLSRELTSVDQAVELRDEHDLLIRGVGYTVYLGSEHEAIMLREAAQAVRQAHRHGLLIQTSAKAAILKVLHSSRRRSLPCPLSVCSTGTAIRITTARLLLL